MGFLSHFLECLSIQVLLSLIVLVETFLPMCSFLDVQHYGEMVGCEATIRDGQGDPIYNLENATRTFLNVTFPPQPLKNLTFERSLGDDITLEINFW